MGQKIKGLESSTTSAQNTDEREETSNLVRIPQVVLERVDEQTILNYQNLASSKKSNKRVTKISDKVTKVLKKSPKKIIDTVVKRPRGRPKKNDESVLSMFKKNNQKLGVKNKTVSSNKSVSSNKTSTLFKKNKLKLEMKKKSVSPKKRLSEGKGKLQSKPGRLLKKPALQKKSKVFIPQSKKTKISPKKLIKPKPPAEPKSNPPKPKLEIIQSKFGESSSDTSEDEFLYDALIETLEDSANRQIVDTKTVPEKTTITLKPNAGNKPPTVLKGGIVKKTDLPSDLNLFAALNEKTSNVMSNGMQKTKQSTVLTPGVKRKSSDIFGPSGPAKKSSPWPVSLIPSPKKSPALSLNSQKKKDLTPQISQLATKPMTEPPKNTYSPFTSSAALPEPSYQSKSVSLGMPKAKIGPKQTATVVPLSKSYGADDYLSDEYLEEETLECDSEVEQLPKESQNKSMATKSNLSTFEPSKNQDANLDLLKILTDDSEEPIKAQSNEAIEEPVESKSYSPITSKEKPITQVPTNTRLDETVEHVKDVENGELPVRTIYDLMNDVFLDYPSWNLHLIPETSAFCIAQVTKGRLGLPTLKKCIELDPVSYAAKVYIHQYHIKRFDGVYDGEESILALIREIDSIKA